MREIDSEIAERKALVAGSAAEGRLAASNAGLAMLERDRRELSARVADCVGLVQQDGRLHAVAATLRQVAPQAARLAEACARAGLRKEAPLDETLRPDGVLAGLLDGCACPSSTRPSTVPPRTWP